MSALLAPGHGGITRRSALAAGLLISGAPSLRRLLGAGTSAPVRLAVDFHAVLQHTDPRALGVGCSTYGANVVADATQRHAERQLDARYVRLPVSWRNGRLTSGAVGGPSNLDVKTLVDTYRSWGWRVLVTLCGVGDARLSLGDTVRIVNALGHAQIEYSAPNEPGRQPEALAEQIAVAKMIWEVGSASDPNFAVWGPVWADFDHDRLLHFANALGARRLAGVDYHRYGMGSTSLPTRAAMHSTGVWGQEVRHLQTSLGVRGFSVPVNVDELNFSWRYRDGTPGGNRRLLSAVNTVWMASTLGHILQAGGRAMPYATQNGPLGLFVEAGTTPLVPGRASSPMPAYWGVAAWTGASLWPHFRDTFFRTSGGDEKVEAFAVSNEAGGYNVVLVNKDEEGSPSRDVGLDLHGVLPGRWQCWQTRPQAPYESPHVVGRGTYVGSLEVTLPPLTVSVLLLTPGN